MAPERHTVAVYGAGAVGGYLGGKLSSTAQCDVTLIGRQRVVDAVTERGLRIRELGAEEVSHPRAVTTAEDLGPCDLVLLTVRTYDVEAAIPELRSLLGEHGLLLAFQNGVGTEEVLADTLGRERILPCTLTVSEGMEEPGVVTRYSKSGGVALSTMTSAAVPGWIEQLFGATGLPTVTVPDYRSLRWSKLLLNMLAAPTSAILDMDITALMSNPTVFRMEREAFLEASAVMSALGIEAIKLPGYPVPLVRRAMRLPARIGHLTLGSRIAAARGGRSPGMRNDIQRGKSEVADFNGAVVREGERLGIPTPVNRTLTNVMEVLTAAPDRRQEFQGRPEVLAAAIEATRLA